jgi:hypothetical protein
MSHKRGSVRCDFAFTAANTVVNSHQFALFHIKLLLLVDRPFVVAMTTQGVAFMLFFQGRLAKGYDIGHG